MKLDDLRRRLKGSSAEARQKELQSKWKTAYFGEWIRYQANYKKIITALKGPNDLPAVVEDSGDLGFVDWILLDEGEDVLVIECATCHKNIKAMVARDCNRQNLLRIGAQCHGIIEEYVIDENKLDSILPSLTAPRIRNEESIVQDKAGRLKELASRFAKETRYKPTFGFESRFSGRFEQND